MSLTVVSPIPPPASSVALNCKDSLAIRHLESRFTPIKTIASLLHYVTIKCLNVHEHLDAATDIRVNHCFCLNYNSQILDNWCFSW